MLNFLENLYNFILLLPISIFFIGFLSILTYKKNLILLLISLEIMLLSINLIFLISSILFDDIVGYLITIFILSIAGSEVSLGLALAILVYRVQLTIYTDSLFFLKT